MAKEITQLQPQVVWNYFYDLTQIPRPTGHTKAASDYVANVGKKLGLKTVVDEVGNVLITKPASAGLENRKVVTLQAHLDMVPQKNADKNHDFEKDPIDTIIDGDWVKADNTTLGADNGIGAALALAILSDNTLKHGPLEALFTIDEEVGMVGANALKKGFLKGDYLLNLDSEMEGEIFIGCAGGIDVNVSLQYKDQICVPAEDMIVKVSLSGLKGGHSGVDIHLGRANANKLMVRFLKRAIEETGACLVSLHGGSLRNAIPREATAILSIQREDADTLWELVSDYKELYNQEYAGIENNIRLVVEEFNEPVNTIIPEEISDGLINACEAVQNGPISYLSDFPGIVESSTNLASISAEKGMIEIKFLVRSSSESRKMMVASAVESAFTLMGARVEFDAAYNGWQPIAHSRLMEVMTEAYKELFGKEPAIKVMHAGLECGIIQGVMPNMEMISFGPTIEHPHSPDERVNISTVDATWKLMVRTLEQL